MYIGIYYTVQPEGGVSPMYSLSGDLSPLELPLLQLVMIFGICGIYISRTFYDYILGFLG